MRVNMNKTKVMISGERQMVRQKDVRWPRGVCSKGVGSNSIQCSSCQKWVHKKCSSIKGSMSKVARIRIGWNKFRQLVPLLTNKDVSLIMRGRLYSSCVRSSMLYGSETWPVRKENVVALQQAEIRMVRWMCGVKLKDRLPSKELRERLGVDDIALIFQQNRLRSYGHVLRKEDEG